MKPNLNRKYIITILSAVILAVALIAIAVCRHTESLGNTASHTPWSSSNGSLTQAQRDSTVSQMMANNNFKRVTVADGLPSHNVYCFMRNDSGYVWIGTSCGLVRYDGIHTYCCPATKNDEVWSMASVGIDSILIGTMSGLKLYQPVIDQLTDVEMPSTIVKAVRHLRNGNILVGTEDGLFITNSQTLRSGSAIKPQKIRIETDMGRSSHVTGIAAEERDGGCWFSTADGLGHIDSAAKSIQMYRMPAALDNSNFFNCLTLKGDTVYLGSFNKGIFAFSIRSKTFSKVEGFDHNLILSLQTYGSYLLVGTNGLGLKVKNLKTGLVRSVVYNDKEHSSISSNTITAISIINGKPWIGTQFDGFCYLLQTDKAFSVYSHGNFFSSDYHVRSFYEYADGAKLIGTRTGLVFVDESHDLVLRYSANDAASGLRSDIITFINKVGNDVLIGTYGGGIYLFDRQHLCLRDLSREELTLYGCVFDIIEDGGGNMWVATQEGLYQMDGSGHELKHYTAEDFGENIIATYKLCKDRVGRLWIGTRIGLYLMDLTTHKIVACPGVPERISVNHIVMDSKGDMLVACNAGLYRINEDLKLLDRYDHKNLLCDDDVKSVFVDRDGSSLWVATRNSITRIETRKKHASRMVMNELKNSSFANALVVNAQGRLWWANDGGLVYINPSRYSSHSNGNSIPTFTAYILDDKLLPLYSSRKRERVIVPSSAKRIELQWADMQLSSSTTDTYEYQLSGYDEEWRTTDGMSAISYEDLPAGNYVLLLRNAETGQSTEIGIEVERDYRYILFSALGLLILIALGWYSYRKTTALRHRLKKERSVMSSAIASRKNTMASRKGSDTDSSILEENLLEYMQTRKPYLNAKLTIGEVAAELSATEADISLLLNNKMNINWSNFVNAYRVEELKHRLREGELARFTLVALAEQCGFTSKTTLHRVFKQITGVTPLEYCKNHNILVEK